MRTWNLIATVFVLAISADLSHAQSQGGCMARGSGPTVLDGSCEYIALDEVQTVLSLTTDFWEVSVTRQCPYSTDFLCKPARAEDDCTVVDEGECPLARDENDEFLLSDRKVVLGEGEGPATVPLPQVSPTVGEKALLKIHNGLQDGGGGTNGVVFVGFFESQTGEPFDDSQFGPAVE